MSKASPISTIVWASAASALMLYVRVAFAEEPTVSEADGEAALPGSPRPVAPSVHPEAPPTPPAPGGRAPSFGAPTDPEAWSFKFNGRVSGWESFGIGERPKDPVQPYDGTPLHVPARTQGRNPFFAGASGSLYLGYGNSLISAKISLDAYLQGVEHEGYTLPAHGPAVRNAFLAITPPPLGALTLRFHVGSVLSSYGAPGQWGWGLWGPLLGVHGYGELLIAEYDVNSDLRLYFEHGVAGVPQVPQGTERLTYTGWAEEGISNFVHHAHAGFTYQNRYVLKAHYASAYGANERTWMADQAESAIPARHHNGRMDVYLLEGHWMGDPWGQVGLSGGLWRFNHAYQVSDGIWWGLDWTAGGREMSNKFLGENSRGTGQIAAVSAEWDFSVGRILAYPAPFSGNAPDLRVALAGIHEWTLNTEDLALKNGTAYFVAGDVEYVITKWLSTTFRVYGSSRDAAVIKFSGSYVHPDGSVTATGVPYTNANGTAVAAGNPVYDTYQDRWVAYNVTPGLAFHTDWQSQDRIELGYSRYFYSKVVDNNTARPLDRNVVTLGARLTF